MDKEKEVLIDFTKLRANPLNDFPLVDIEELEASIRADELLSAFTVIGPYDDGTYRLISGHRRQTALKNLMEKYEDIREKYQQVPCVVVGDKNMSPTRQKYLIEVANVQTRDINKNEHAFKMVALLKQLCEENRANEAHIARELAAVLHKSPRYGRMYRDIFEKDESGEIRERVIKSDLAVSDAAAIVNFDKKAKEQAIESLKKGEKAKDILAKKRGKASSKEVVDLDALKEVDFDSFFEENFGSDDQLAKNLSVDSTGLIGQLMEDDSPTNTSYTGKISPEEKQAKEAAIVLKWCKRMLNYDYDDFSKEENDALNACIELAEKFA